MTYPNATGQYHLFVNAAFGDEANSGGLGAVLMQDQEAGLRKPVAYASRQLVKHERNYPVFLGEMQAAVFGMKQFHHFLITGRFVVLEERANPDIALSRQRAEADPKKRQAADFPFPNPYTLFNREVTLSFRLWTLFEVSELIRINDRRKRSRQLVC
jgi:hypothetical protein